MGADSAKQDETPWSICGRPDLREVMTRLRVQHLHREDAVVLLSLSGLFGRLLGATFGRSDAVSAK